MEKDLATIKRPSVVELFHLDHLDPHHQVGNHQYAFLLDGLFEDTQRVLIDAETGTVRRGDPLLAETRLNEMHLHLFVAFVLAHPFPVAAYQILNLSDYLIASLKEGCAGAQQVTSNARLEERIGTCNQQLFPLGIKISPSNLEFNDYRISSIQAKHATGGRGIQLLQNGTPSIDEQPVDHPSVRCT
ncbi:hypothetical protein KSF_106290 [Reticulibacter mediterranei]|uniref:Uncharacterized protein n=1 Tax=Reticulibacter mediterranei TaxID=2778369 RepID=A0A8J3J4J7_9CHLR|nr:hypothetical protein [Reticulibacter mediterranei]GHP00582.1 hypothetical protein KSF_106290 [Reticulibacter mediterranei]